MEDLICILSEELEVLSDHPEDTTTKDVQAMRRALKKLSEGNHILTVPEKSAVRFALEDVGELYLFAGTSAGFDVEDADSASEAQQVGRKAREQAYQLGIKL